MVRKKKPVWEHFLKTESGDDRKHPSVQCKYCDKSYKRAVPKRMQAHLDECSNAPNNAKSQNITTRVDDFDDRINEEKKSFELLPAKAFGPFPFIDVPLVQWYQKEANNKNKEAQYHLGRSYEHGDGIEKDDDKAFKWYKKSAKQNYSKAQCRIGLFYESGIGVEKDDYKAFEWYKKAANNGSKEAQYFLGRSYKHGKGIEEDKNKAFKWYKKAAKNGSKEAQYKLGKHYENVDEDKAVKWYQKAAKNGSKKAQNRLGSFYRRGFDLEKDNEDNEDYDKAVKWYQKAAKNGSKYAQYELGRDEKDKDKAFKWYRKSAENGMDEAMQYLAICYYVGIGTEINLEKAFYWTQKLAKKGYIQATYHLAQCYENGVGTESNLEKAFNLYQKSAEMGNMDGICELIICYENGKGTEKNLEKASYWKEDVEGNGISMYKLAQHYKYRKNLEMAFDWYPKAAEESDEIFDRPHKLWAMNDLAKCYENGEGTEKNLEMAFHWYQKAVLEGGNYKPGYMSVMYNLAICYCDGKETEKNLEKAFYWYQKVADGYFPLSYVKSLAMYNLAICYCNGEGTEKDLKMAFYWYQKAANNGHVRAKCNLAECYENGNAVEKDAAISNPVPIQVNLNLGMKRGVENMNQQITLPNKRQRTYGTVDNYDVYTQYYQPQANQQMNMLLQNVYSLNVLDNMNPPEHMNSFFQLDINSQQQQRNIFEQIKDFIHYNSTKEQELLIDELILNEELKDRYKRYGLCKECKQPNIGGDFCIGYCQSCNANHFRQNFKNWTSGNRDIDEFIQNAQLKAKNFCEVLEWIEYDRFENVEYVEADEQGLGKMYFVCVAYWKDGCIKGWDSENNQWVRYKSKEEYHPVDLKYLLNSQSITVELLRDVMNANDVGYYPYYGITKEPKTNAYILIAKKNFIFYREPLIYFQCTI